MKTTVVVADSDEKSRKSVIDSLESFKESFDILGCSSAVEASEYVRERAIDIIVCEDSLSLPDETGAFSEILLEHHPNISVIVLAKNPTVEDAVELVKSGADDYIPSTQSAQSIAESVRKVAENRLIAHDNEAFRPSGTRRPNIITGMVYISEQMEEVISKVARAAASTATVLIYGESGTGKELVARAIHEAGERAKGPFIAINCSAIPENLMESEFFGHEKGAFTGAEQQRIGRFEQAESGTLFLDEIADIPLHMQAKLLRVLQEREFRRVGGNETIHTNIRIVAAANKNITELVEKQLFREDLYYRLNVVNIYLPPLRERKADIPVLAEHFLEQYVREHEMPEKQLSPDAIDRLVKYSFPGNIRELGNIIEQAVVLTRNAIITAEDLPLEQGEIENRASNFTLKTLDDKVENLERNELRQALIDTEGNKSAAARLLGITERRIRYILKKYGEHTIYQKTEL